MSTRGSSRRNKILVYILILQQFFYLVSSSENNCYDHANKPMRCSPDFINAAFNRPVVATNTCGNFFLNDFFVRKLLRLRLRGQGIVKVFPR